MDDVAKFFKTYYAPNNAVLVISGDFQTPDAKKLVQQYFGDLSPQPQPKRPDMTEAERTIVRQSNRQAYANPVGTQSTRPQDGPARPTGNPSSKQQRRDPDES